MERAVIGAMLINPAVIAEVATILKPADFFLLAAGRAAEIIFALHDAGKEIDLLTVDTELKARKIESVEASDLARWAAEIAIASHAVTHAEAVKKFSDARAMTRICQDSLEQLSTLADEPKKIGDQLTTRILQIATGSRRQFVSLEQATVTAIKSIEKSADGKGTADAVPTGLSAFDATTGGLFRGQLVLVAGRTSMGKTALAMTMVKGAAQAGYTAAVVSAESPSNSIVLRLFSAETGIENRDLRRGQLQERDYYLLANAAGRLAQLPIFLYDRERNWETIKAQLRAFKMQHPELALVAIDYVQLLTLRTREDRWQQIGQISSEAKELALELDAALILLSQINRDVEKRQDKRPTLADLRESGNLEQDADVVGLLYRDYYYDHSKPKEEAELDIAKNRDGATGVVDLRFYNRTASFADPPAAPPEQESFL